MNTSKKFALTGAVGALIGLGLGALFNHPPTQQPISAPLRQYGVTRPSTDFQRALAQTLRYEGGKVNNPADPGGRTNRGVTQHVFTAYLRGKGQPNRDVYTITDAEVSDIYYRQYWLPVAQHRVWPLNMALFDVAVNSGVPNAEWMLMRAKAQHPEYSNLQPEALRQLKLSYALTAVRRQFFRDIVARRPASNVFLPGWLRRCDQVEQMCSTPAGPVFGVPAGLPAPNSVASPRTTGFSAAELLKDGK